MKKLLIAAAAVVGFASIASAQQAPYLAGNYSPDVIQSYNNDERPVNASGGSDGFTSQASAVNSYESDRGVLSAQTTDDLRSGQ